MTKLRWKSFTTKFCKTYFHFEKQWWRCTVGCGEWSLNQLCVMGTRPLFPLLYIHSWEIREKNTRCALKHPPYYTPFPSKSGSAPSALAIGLAYHPHSLQTSGPIGPWPPPPTWSAWSSISCRSLSPPPWKLFLSLWSGSCDTAATDMCGQRALNNVSF